MAEEKFVSLETLGQGAAVELFSEELKKVLENVLDPNTKATATRSVTLKLVIKPDEDRQFANTALEASSKLAPTRPVGVPIFIVKHAGQAVATERDTKQLAFEDNVTSIKDGTNAK